MECVEIASTQAGQFIGRQVRLKGHVHALRRLGNIAFLVLRDAQGTLQVTAEDKSLLDQVDRLHCEAAVVVEGLLAPLPKTQAQTELRLEKLAVLSSHSESLPVEINKDQKMDSLSLSALLDYRPLTLRNPKVRSIFKIESVIAAAFREFLGDAGFVEIHSPKIVSTGTEGGANLFAVAYFGKQAFLAQSPQFYKQMMVGVFEKVFEIGPVYRAEEHDTSRHLNEYISMDLEMGFISDEQDVMSLEVELLKHIFERLQKQCPEELAVHGAKVPNFSSIPQLTLDESCQLLQSKLGWKGASAANGVLPGEQPIDLDPEAERLLCDYFATKEGCDLVFVTRYPRLARPFYTMPASDGKLTHSFDLLFRGLEITTGGQRIHKVEELVKSIAEKRMDPEKFGDYLQCFRYGMPPHGGLAIGMERLTKQLLNLPNVKLASLFPRDRNRLTP